ncbi:DUF6366 family protein [Bacillus shivajii]|uniref:DUF6366 family protein n=1 Tax=Bacillus shivajii TaxID=1983719 RepID=UPI001CF983AA|nr:DUF6366 family protein [Bacillus shivajii]UCZ51482.1 DUF6366 family protein [Bacillus shivajii]
MSEGKQDKFNREESKRNPMGNFADGVNQSQVGNIGELARGGCLTNIFTLVVIILGVLFLSQCVF